MWRTRKAVSITAVAFIAIQTALAVETSFTVKTNDDMDLGRASNFEDLLQRIPGVSSIGKRHGSSKDFNSRSGITSEDKPLGVMFLMDGLNFNQGNGETTLEDF
jgi:outer membrane receptor for Fe3+-dicitrate